MIRKSLMLLVGALGLIGCGDQARLEAEARTRTKFGEAEVAAYREDWSTALGLLGEISTTDFPRDDTQFEGRVSELRRRVTDRMAGVGSVDAVKSLIKKREWVRALEMLDSLSADARLSDSPNAELERLRVSLRDSMGEM